jgi:hypothetical protein
MSRAHHRGGGRGSGASAAKTSQTRELLKRSAAEAGLDASRHHLKVLSDVITGPPLFPDFHWHSAGGYWEGAGTDRAGAEGKKAASELLMNSSSNPKRSSQAAPLTLAGKQKELEARFQRSAHYVRSVQQRHVVDVRRYSRHQQRQRESAAHCDDAALPADEAVLRSMGSTAANRKLACDERYFPAELLHPAARQGGASFPPNSSNNRQAAAGEAAPPDVGGVERVKLDELESRERGGGGGNALMAAEGGGGGAGGEEQPPDEAEELTMVGPDAAEDDEEAEDYTTNYYQSDDESEDGGDGEATF